MAKPHLMVEYYDLVKRRELWRRLAERPRNVRAVLGYTRGPGDE